MSSYLPELENLATTRKVCIWAFAFVPSKRSYVIKFFIMNLPLYAVRKGTDVNITQ